MKYIDSQDKWNIEVRFKVCAIEPMSNNSAIGGKTALSLALKSIKN